MKKIDNKEIERLVKAEVKCNAFAIFTIEDIVDEESTFNVLNYDIKLFKQWIRVYNNMRIMRGLDKLDGFNYYWHCLK